MAVEAVPAGLGRARNVPPPSTPHASRWTAGLASMSSADRALLRLLAWPHPPTPTHGGSGDEGGGSGVGRGGAGEATGASLLRPEKARTVVPIQRTIVARKRMKHAEACCLGTLYSILQW